MKEILDIIHKTIYQFFDVCGDDEEEPISDKDKLLLEVNKAICDNLKTLQQEPKLTGEWKHNNFDEHYCNKCGHYALWSEEADGYYEVQSDFCPNCGADMRRLQTQKLANNRQELVKDLVKENNVRGEEE